MGSLLRKIKRVMKRCRSIDISERVEIFSKEEKQWIQSVAAGQSVFLRQAVAAHRRAMLIYGILPLDPYQRFMREVDNPCPDIGLRAYYREALLRLESFAENDAQEKPL